MPPVEALLGAIVDYAGLFPPSSLNMTSAVANYARYRNGPHSWMLGRFVVPVARLDEFEAALPENEYGWPVAALAGANLEADLERIGRTRAASIETIELKAETAGQVELAASRVPATLAAFVEIPLDGKIQELLEAIASSGVRAKIRTGGITPESFPSAENLARFLVAAARFEIPFKATAGLHHPVRCYRPLTYTTGGPHGWMFGFLNLFLASALARDHAGEAIVKSALLEESAGAFVFEEDGLRWRDYRLEVSQLAATRISFALSFGSCSFEEPVQDLQALGLL